MSRYEFYNWCIIWIIGEEEVFYIFLSFFKNTEYPLIFSKDLKKLKIYFYVFNRIIQLLVHELYSKFEKLKKLREFSFEYNISNIDFD